MPPTGGTIPGGDPADGEDDSTVVPEEEEDDQPVEEEEKTWYLDNDNDGYHIETRVSISIPTNGNWVATTHGIDCDDNNPDKKTKGDCFNLDDPCTNKDLRNKKVSDIVKREYIDNRTRMINGFPDAIPEFVIHDIEDAFGEKINVDKYELNITRLPLGMDAENLFNNIRLNFDSFVIGTDDTVFGLPLNSVNLEPYSEEDRVKWNSPNPIGAVMNFHTLADTASVIASEFSSNEMFWTFTTIKSINHFSHPVSGHRQFRLKSNQDGSFTFVIRGADRLTSLIDEIANEYIPSEDDEFAFELADKTWKSLMENIEDYIKNNGGETQPFNPNIDYGKRHPWNINDCE